MFKQWITNLGEKILALVISRKFWAAVAAQIIVLTTPGLTPVQIATATVTIWSTFIAGTAVEDGLRGR
jgi:hypothetical protein